LSIGLIAFVAEVSQEPERDDLAWKAFGEFVRAQRKLARLSLRQMAEMAQVSNPYLSQIERGLYRPSAQVIKSIASALHISAEALYTQVGLLDSEPVESGGVEEAIRLDPRMGAEQKAALIHVYRNFVGGDGVAPPASASEPEPAPEPAPRPRRKR
jgi:transcriptional regulator with XRE-family HTH domain